MNIPLLVALGIGGYIMLQDSKPTIKATAATQTRLDFTVNGIAFTANFPDPLLGQHFSYGAYKLHATRHIENSTLVGYQITVYNLKGKFLDLINVPLRA